MTHSENTYLQDNQLADRYSVSRPTIWRWVRNGQFPQPVKLSPGCTRWKLADLLEWEESRGY